MVRRAEEEKSMSLEWLLSKGQDRQQVTARSSSVAGVHQAGPPHGSKPFWVKHNFFLYPNLYSIAHATRSRKFIYVL